MKRTRLTLIKTLLLALLLLSLTTPLYAEDTPLEFLTHINGDEDVKFFNPTGLYQKIPEQVTVLQKDWIIQTGEDSIELTLIEGALRIGSDTLLAIDALSVERIDIFVMKGSVRAVSDSDVPINLLTKSNQYSFATGDFTLIKDGLDERFFTNEGAAEASTLTDAEKIELDTHSTITGGVVATVEEETIRNVNESLPITFYKRAENLLSIEVSPTPVDSEPEIVLAEAPPVDTEESLILDTPEPVTEIAAIEPEVVEPELVAELPVEDDILIMVEPEEEIPVEIPEPVTEIASVEDIPAKDTEHRAPIVQDIELILDDETNESTKEGSNTPSENSSVATSTNTKKTESIDDTTNSVDNNEEATTVVAKADLQDEAINTSEDADSAALIDEKKKIEESSLDIDATITTGLGYMHQLGTSSPEEPYISTALYPEISIGKLDLGFRLYIAFNGNPINVSSWYSPRGDNLWNYGGGTSGFVQIEDIATDALSLIDHVYYGDPEDTFYINLDREDTITFGNGSLLSDLQTSIDSPYLERAGLYSSINSPYYQQELLVDDIYHSSVYGARFAVTPLPVSFPFSIGIFTLADISTSPTKILMTPGIDLIMPILKTENSSMNLIADAAGMMVFDFENDILAYDASFSGGVIQNILASAGISGTAGNLSYELIGAYDRGNLSYNMFGEDYQWRRSEIISLIDDYTTDATETSYTAFASLGYDSRAFGTSLSYRLPFSASFAPDLSSDRLNLSVNAHIDNLTAEIGYSSDGLIDSLMNGPFDLFSTDNRLYGSLAYDLDDINLKVTYSHIAEYDTTDYLVANPTTIPTLSIESNIRLFTTEKSEVISSDSKQTKVKKSESLFTLGLGTAFMDSAIDTYDLGPYTALEIYPGLRTKNFELTLGFGVVTNGNPFLSTDWYYEGGNNPLWLFSDPITADMYSIRSTALQILSFIDHMEINSADDPYHLLISDQENISMGTGTMISDLLTAIDYPFVTRTALYSHLDTDFFESEIFVNDLNNTQLMGLRFGITPVPNVYAAEIGLSAITDITLQSSALADTSATQMIMVPGVDLSLPILDRTNTNLSLFTDFYMLMVLDEGFKTEALTNYLASVGLNFSQGVFSTELSLAYDHGLLDPNMFGRDYSWRRKAVCDALINNLNDPLEVDLDALLSFGIQTEVFSFNGFVNMQMTTSFALDFSDNTSNMTAPDIFGFDTAVTLDNFQFALGYAKRGISYDLRNGSFDFFDNSSQFYADMSYATGDIELYGRFSSVGEYQDERNTDYYLDHDDDPISETVSPAYTIGTVLHLL